MPVNRIEALKAARDGLDVLPDLHRYAAVAAAGGDPAIPPDDLERLKWYGLFHRKPTPGYFMLRLLCPGGVLTAGQLTAIGELSNEVGRGEADLTSRMGVQLRWITIADAPRVLQRIAAAGLTSQQSGMDNIRNVVGCPLAGLGADELFDTRRLARRLQQAIIGGKRFSNLPRKFNISLTGCREDCGEAQGNDLSFTPAERDGEIGFNVLVGGALGGASPEFAQPLDVFVGVDQSIALTLAVLEVFRDHGPREKRSQARLKWLLREWGAARFREAVAAQYGQPLARAGAPLTTGHSGDHIGVVRQRDPALRVVGCLVPVGRITGDDLIAFADLSQRYGSAELRLTMQQNIVIPNVPAQRLEALLAEPLLERYSPAPSPFIRAMLTCTGNDYCPFALIDSKGEGLKLARELERRYAVAEGVEPLRIQMSACPNACARHRSSEIGLLGRRKRIDGELVDVADVFTGGRLGGEPALAEESASSVPLVDLPEAVAEQIRKLRGDALVKRGESIGAD